MLRFSSSSCWCCSTARMVGSINDFIISRTDADGPVVVPLEGGQQHLHHVRHFQPGDHHRLHRRVAFDPSPAAGAARSSYGATAPGRPEQLPGRDGVVEGRRVGHDVGGQFQGRPRLQPAPGSGTRSSRSLYALTACSRLVRARSTPRRCRVGGRRRRAVRPSGAARFHGVLIALARSTR